MEDHTEATDGSRTSVETPSRHGMDQDQGSVIQSLLGLSPAWTVTKLFLVQFAVGLFIGYIASLDLASSILQTLIEGWVLLLASTIILIGSAALLVMHKTRSATWGQIALAGSTLSSVMAVSLIYMQRKDIYLWNRMLVWLAMAALCFWCVYRLIRGKVPLPNPTRIVAVLSIPTILSVLNFLYPNVYKPAAEPYSLILNVEFGNPVFDRAATVAALPITIRMRNPSNVRVYAVGSNYSVLGRRRLGGTLLSEDDNWKQAVEEGEPVQKNRSVNQYDVLQADEFTGPGEFFEPSAERTTTRIIQVPTAEPYDVLVLRARVLVMRGDNLMPIPEDQGLSWHLSRRRVDLANRFPKDTRFQWTTYSLQGRTALQRLTRRPDLVYSFWILGIPDGHGKLSSHPFIWSVVTRRGDEDRLSQWKPPPQDQPQPGAAVAEYSTWQLQVKGSARRQ